MIFLWNVGGNVGRGIEIELEGVSRPSACFGVRVELYAGTQPASVVLRGPVGWLGIGTAREADAVRILWPDGSVQSHLDVALPERGRLHLVRGGPRFPS